MAKRIKLPGRAESAEVGGVVAGANTIYDDAKGKTQDVVNSEVDAELVRLEESKQDNLTFDNAPTEGSQNPVMSGGVYTADKALSDAIEAILLLIPSAASVLNQLADKKFVQDSVATSTANFRGTYNVVSDLHLSANASHAQIEAALDALSLGADTNDYCFVQVPDNESTENIKKTERYKFNGSEWAYEYDLNNSGFTAAQWEAINSNITALLVTKLSQLPTNEVLTALLAAKQDNLTFDDEPTAGSNNPVTSGGIATRNNEIVAMITALEAAKQDKLTFDSVPVNGSENPVMSGGVYDAIYLVQVALAGLDGRMLSAEHSIEVLTEDVGILRTLYQALSQSDIVVGAKPTTGVANIIYRVPGQSTYADWMWYDGAWVKLAEYTTLDGYLYKGIATPNGSPAASAVKMFYFALIAGTYTNFGNLVVTEGISILKYDGANWTQDKLYYGDGGVFDISKYNLTNGQPTPYPDLEAALGSNGVNVPEPLRKGGMSVKFIQGTAQSSDNKYIRYNLIADEFTTDTTQWAIADVGVYVENPEFIYVKTDAESKILWAIKTDGTIYFGAGVPPQVVDYIQQRIKGFSPEEYEDIVDFIGGLVASDKNLQELLDEKVDETYIENPEFIGLIIDANNKILFGIRYDGDIYCAEGVPSQIKRYIEVVNSSLEKKLTNIINFNINNDDIIKRNYDKIPMLAASCEFRKSSQTSKDFQIVLVTDSHNDTICTINAIKAANGFKYIDALVHCGDIVASYFPLGYNANSLWRNIIYGSIKPCYFILGNHEKGTYPAIYETPTDQELYEAFIKPMVEDGWLVQGEYTANKCYWFHDFTSQRIRLIAIDEYEAPLIIDDTYWELIPYNSSLPSYGSMFNESFSEGDEINVTGYSEYSFRAKQDLTGVYHYNNLGPSYKYKRGYRWISQIQAEWFLDKLATTPSGYQVIVGCHNPFSDHADVDQTRMFSQKNEWIDGHGMQNYMTNDFIADAINAFQTKTNFSTICSSLYPEDMPSYNVSKDFSSVVGIFHSLIGGHVHQDCVWKHQTYNQYQITPICTNSNQYEQCPNADIRRENSSVKNTIDTDCLTVVSYGSERIGLVKIGVNVTETGKKRDFEIINI